jgi:hypothetical protein
MDSSVSAKNEIWFLRVCDHISNAAYLVNILVTATGQFTPVRFNPSALQKALF